MKERIKSGGRKLKNQVVSIDFAKYFVTGVVAFLVDTLVLNIISFLVFSEQTNVELFGIISIAKLISGSVGITVSFYMNRKWSFQATSGSKRKQGIKMALSFAFSILAGSIMFTLYLDLLNLQNLVDFGKSSTTIANALTTGTLMFLNFFIYKFIVFKK